MSNVIKLKTPARSEVDLALGRAQDSDAVVLVTMNTGLDVMGTILAIGTAWVMIWFSSPGPIVPGGVTLLRRAMIESVEVNPPGSVVLKRARELAEETRPEITLEPVGLLDSVDSGLNIASSAPMCIVIPGDAMQARNAAEGTEDYEQWVGRVVAIDGKGMQLKAAFELMDADANWLVDRETISINDVEQIVLADSYLSLMAEIDQERSENEIVFSKDF